MPPHSHPDLRVALITAALELARDGGAGGVSLRAVARRAGVSEAAPYHHFRHKRELLAAAAVEGFRLLDAALAAGVAGLSPGGAGDADELSALGAAYVRFSVAEPGVMGLVLGAHVVDLGLDRIEALRAAAAPTTARLADAVDRALPAWPEAARRRFQLSLWSHVVGVARLVNEKELPGVSTPEAAAALAAEGVRQLLRGASVDGPPPGAPATP